MNDDSINAEQLAHAIADAMTDARRRGLERRDCTSSTPMRHEDKDAYLWIHVDAEYVEPFFNLAIYKCPHCWLHFTAKPREQ